MEALAARLGWEVSDNELLTRSLSHRSWCAETPGSASNERLEFLGDAVLGVVVTDYLFRTYPLLPEGELAKVRASVVNSAALAEVAATLDIGDALLLGKGEDQSGGREKPSILADAMEAVIGAVYLDQGCDAATDLVMRLLGDRIEEAAAGCGELGILVDFGIGCLQNPTPPVLGIVDRGAEGFQGVFREAAARPAVGYIQHVPGVGSSANSENFGANSVNFAANSVKNGLLSCSKIAVHAACELVQPCDTVS